MVLFDMDGLLLDTERVCLDCGVKVGLQNGLRDMEEIFLRMIGHSRNESEQILETALGGRYPIDSFLKQWDSLIDEQMDINLEIKSGVFELLELLKSRGTLTAVATSTRIEKARRHLKNAGLIDFFELIVGGDQVQKRKPDPEIYHKVAAGLGQKASDCIVFEDSDPGVLAGVRSGAKVVQVPDIKEPSTATIALGHIIAPDLLSGARMVGLI